MRDLERLLARILRKAAAKDAPHEVFTEKNLREYVGRPRHLSESAEHTGVPGVATGSPSQGRGGHVLFVGASLAERSSGATGVTLTGQLGDVMKESVQLAMSFLRSHHTGARAAGRRARRPGRAPARAGRLGAKDGPSAGVTMTTALASLLSGRPVRSDVAMTGEIPLTGLVLPIGGVKQKLLAAHRAGITTVIIPPRNEPDLDDVPASVLAVLEVHPLSGVRDVRERCGRGARRSSPPTPETSACPGPESSTHSFDRGRRPYARGTSRPAVEQPRSLVAVRPFLRTATEEGSPQQPAARTRQMSASA